MSSQNRSGRSNA